MKTIYINKYLVFRLVLIPTDQINCSMRCKICPWVHMREEFIWFSFQEPFGFRLFQERGERQAENKNENIKGINNEEMKVLHA